MTQNDQQYRKTCGKIAIAMCIFYGLFNVLTVIATLCYTIFDEIALILPGNFAWTVISEIIGEILVMLAYFLSFAIPAWILDRMMKKSEAYRPICFQGKLPRATVLLIFAAVAINFTIAFLNNEILSWISPVANNSLFLFAENEKPEVQTIILSFLSVGVVPALCEEYLFRGAILSALLPYGKKCAIFGSAFLFGLMHQNPYQMLYTMLLGLVLACIYIKTRSIWICVLIHFFNNSISVLESVLYQYENYMAVYLLEILLMLLGVVSVILLLRAEKKKKKPEDQGSFGVLFEAEPDYAVYPLSQKTYLRGFFHPAMIVFVSLASVTMILTIILMGVLGI